MLCYILALRCEVVLSSCPFPINCLRASWKKWSRSCSMTPAKCTIWCVRVVLRVRCVLLRCLFVDEYATVTRNLLHACSRPQRRRNKIRDSKFYCTTCMVIECECPGLQPTDCHLLGCFAPNPGPHALAARCKCRSTQVSDWSVLVCGLASVSSFHCFT